MEALFAEAQQLFAAKKFYDAVGKYAALIDDDRATTADKVRGFNNISACYASTGDFSKALDAAKQAHELDRTSVRACTRCGTACEGLQYYEEAKAYYQKALDLDSADATAAQGLRRTSDLLAAGKGQPTPEARNAFYFKKSVEGAKAAMQTGTYTEAARLFSKAIDLLPPDADAHQAAVLHANRSAAHFHLSNMEESAADARASVERAPGYARGHYRLACALHALQQHSEAYDALQRCLDLDAAHADAAKLMEEVAPVALQQRMSAANRRRETEQRVQELREKQNEEAATATALPATRAYASNYVYCRYCNESGHTVEDCPLRRRKRPRPPA